VDADDLQRAVTSSRSLLVGVRPEQMDGGTPCQEWKVRDLINHMVDAPTFAAIVMETGDWRNQITESLDHSAGDYLADYEAATSRAMEAFRAEGALSRVVTLPFGEMPGSIFANIATGDAFVHGWDLAKATGSSTDLDPELAASLLDTIRPMVTDQFRGPEGKAPFGGEVPVPANASPADKLAGFLGRQP
jgi:uncharacterized protein (TIGR03086 family)